MANDPAAWRDVIVPRHVHDRLARVERAIAAAASRLDEFGPLHVLVWGAPGVGKTAVLFALAESTGMHLVVTAAGDFRGGYFGDCARLTRAVFERARIAAPSVVTIDAFQYVCPRTASHVRNAATDEIATELLWQIETLRKVPVFIIAETYEATEVDAAVLSRMHISIEIPRPDVACRAEILRRCLRERRVDPKLDVEGVSALIAEELEAATGRDLVTLVQRASARARADATAAEDAFLTREVLLEELASDVAYARRWAADIAAEGRGAHGIDGEPGGEHGSAAGASLP